MSLNIETYKVRKMNQLKHNLDRSFRLLETIEGIGKMTGGDVKQLDEMIAGIKKNLASVETGKVMSTGEQLINEAQVDDIKQWVQKAKEVMNEALELAKKEKDSGAKVSYPSFESKVIGLDLDEKLVRAASPLSVASVASSKVVASGLKKKLTSKSAEVAKPSAVVVTKPSVVVAKPSSAVAKPSSAVAKPSSAVAKPSSAVAKPSSAVAKPSYVVAKPPSAVATPSSVVAKPSAVAAEPLKKANKEKELKPLTAIKADIQSKISGHELSIADLQTKSGKSSDKKVKAGFQKQIATLQANKKKEMDELKVVNANIQKIDQKYKGATEKYQRWGWWD